MRSRLFMGQCLGAHLYMNINNCLKQHTHFEHKKKMTYVFCNDLVFGYVQFE